MHRREFLTGAAVPVAALAASKAPELLGAEERHSRITSSTAYKYRIAFGAWMNDMRLTPLPLEEWPAPQLDDTTVNSLIRTMDVQHDAGFNMFDVWGFFATYGWPVDIVSAVTPERAATCP